MKHLFNSLKLSAWIFIASFTLSACNGNGDNTDANTESDSTAAMNMQSTSDSMAEHAVAQLSGVIPDTTLTGTARFDAVEGSKVKMHLELTVPAKANHSVAVHIHENGDCGDMGKAAGGHWNPTNANHGKWGSNSFHSGDIGNVSLDANGKGSIDMETDLWSLGGDPQTNILDKAIIVHGGEDDYTTQPSGNAGTRIGCGLIQKQ